MQILVKADTILYYSYDFILTFANQLMPLILHQRKRNFYRYMNTPTLTEKLLSLDLSKPIVEYLAALSDADFISQSETLFDKADSIQELLLKQILFYAKDSKFGKEHGFKDIKNIEDFRKNVPVLYWEDILPYVEQAANGKADMLFPGLPTYFSITSGTTGKEKLIPDNALSACARNLALRYRLAQIRKYVPNLMSGKLFPLSNNPSSSTTPAGIPCGTASGLTLGKAGLDKMLAFPVSVLSITDGQSRDYVMMRLAIEKEDVMFVVGNNAVRMVNLLDLAIEYKEDIINDIERGGIKEGLILDADVRGDLEKTLSPNPSRAAYLRKLVADGKPFTPASYWKEMKMAMFWLSSSVGRNVDEVRPYFDSSVKFMDAGYGSSEAKLNIPMMPEEKSGALSIATSFYEFIPVDGGEPLLAHQLEDGHEYELVVTTWAGLYRYNMKDIIRVDGFVGNTPKIEFMRKSGDLLNIAGEKLPAIRVDNTIRQLLNGKGLEVRQSQIYQDLDNRRYVCYVEVKDGTLEVDDELQKLFNDKLVEDFPFFELIFGQKLLNPAVLVPMKSGWQEALYAKKLKQGVTKSQIKIPLLIKEPADEIWKM